MQDVEVGASERAFPGAVLTLAQAAWASGLSRAELESAVRAGELSVRRVVRAGRAVPVVALDELERLHHRTREQRRAAQAEEAGLRTRVARLEGELAASERVERSLQRWADRMEERTAARLRELETSLAEARRREMTLARVLGQKEALLARYESLSAPRA